MFTGVAGEDGGGRVPKIRSCNGKDINVFVFEDATEVRDGFGSLAVLAVGREFGSGGEAILIHITDVGDLDAFELGEVADVCLATAESHDADAEFLAGLGLRVCAGYERGSSDSADEMATVLHSLLLEESVPAGEPFEVSSPIVYSILLMEEPLKMDDVESCEIPSALANSFYENLA